MAERPIFVPAPDEPELVKEIYVPMTWHPGFAAIQKEKNVAALHASAAALGYAPLLEISSRSSEKLGRHLSAFHLQVRGRKGEIPLESAFQGSKMFERGGPFTELYAADARTAKRDPRLRDSGRIVAFEFEGTPFPAEPRTAFYDWLYINAIYPHREWLVRLRRYAAFTDIEFNPERSVNCQARSCALFVSLMSNGLLDGAVESPERFISMMRQSAYAPRHVGQRTIVSHRLVRVRNAVGTAGATKGRGRARKPRA
jgi:hypothetical protein